MLNNNRRDILKLSLALGATPLWARLAAASQPSRGGFLKLASRHGSTTDTTDPALGTNGYQVLLGLAFANTLTEVLPDGTVGPALAESWESSDAKTWRLKLRKGVTFHNGRSFVASDAVASLNHHRSEESKSYVKPIASQFASVAAAGEHELLITLKDPNADLPAILNIPAFTIFPADGEKMDWASRIGTGGYILKSFDPGIGARLVRNPNYYRDDRAFFEEAELLCVQDSTARTNALLSGEVHAIDEVEVKTSDMLATQQSIALERVAGPLHYTFPMRTDTAPFNDVNVRLALKHAIDRQEILEKVLYGFGSLGNDTPIGPSYRYWAKNIEQRAYDPDRAKFHLKKAGMGSLKVDLSTAEAAFSGATDAALLYAQHAGKAGIEINVVREPNDAYWDNIWMKKAFCACYWGGYPTEGEMFAIGYAPGAAWNDTNWTEPKFESLRKAVLAELDTDKRRGMYAEMQQIVRDDGGALVFAFAEYVMALSKKLAHGPLSTGGSLDGYRAVERWWFTS